MSKLQYELCAQSILGKLSLVETLLHAGAEPFTTVGGCGALCHAAFHGHKMVVLKIVCYWSAFTDLGIYRETNVAEMIELALFLAQRKNESFIANYLNQIYTLGCKSISH